ncbi:MAG: hypothetical protein ACTH6W_00995 [Marinomonas polaris]
MDKLNKFQDILHHYVHSVSSILADYLRPAIAASCLFLSFFVLTPALFSISNLSVINIDPILNAGLVYSFVFTTLLLVSYWSVMTNINPARQILAFSLFRVFAPNERLNRAEARCMMRCGAPFFRFR